MHFRAGIYAEYVSECITTNQTYLVYDFYAINSQFCHFMRIYEF